MPLCNPKENMVMVDKVVGVSFLESLAGAQGALHVPVDKLEFENSVYPGQPNFPYIFSAADFEHKTRKGYGGFQCKGHLGKSKEGVLNKDRAACS